MGLYDELQQLHEGESLTLSLSDDKQSVLLERRRMRSERDENGERVWRGTSGWLDFEELQESCEEVLALALRITRTRLDGLVSRPLSENNRK